MKIVEVAVRHAPYVGGVENTVRRLSAGMRDLGHEVVVVCGDHTRPGEEPPPDSVDGIRVRRLAPFASLGNTLLARGVVAAIRDEAPDLVHGHLTPPWWIDCASIAADRLGRPFVVTYNNDVVAAQGGPLRAAAALYNRFVLPRTLRRAARIVVPNPRVADRSPALQRGELRERLINIPWGVDLSRFRVRGTERSRDSALTVRIGFLALLDHAHEYKGLIDLLRALPIARQTLVGAPPVVLVVGGSGDAEAFYRAEASRLGVTDAVEFVGFVPEDALPNFFAGLDLFALPSRSLDQEGFGLVLLEAMACGVPVVASTVPAVAEAVHRERAGWIVDPGDVEALAHTLAEAARDPEERRVRGTHARRLVERDFGWESIARAYDQLFSELVPPLPATSGAFAP